MEKEPRRTHKPIIGGPPASATEILQTYEFTNKTLWTALRVLHIKPPKGSHKGKAHPATAEEISMFLKLGTHSK